MRTARPVGVFVLVALLVLAGCGGLDGADSGTDAPTTAAVTESTATAPGPGAETTTGGESPTPTATRSDTATATTSPTPLPDRGNATATFRVDEEAHRVTLEVADERAERRRGLMNRTSLPENHGMVFVYDEAAPRTFWMKNTLIPLDIIFVAPNGTVLNVEHARTQPNASDSDLERYHSDGPAQYVVEMERGFANRTGVESGTEVTLDLPAESEDGDA